MTAVSEAIVNKTNSRRILQIIPASPTQDGDGVKISRIQGVQHQRMDPFLLIDMIRSEESSDYIGGFPPHPHRGMETLTYMKQGGLVHEDSLGNRGEITTGGAQWMSAGRGVIHSEMPTLDNQGLFGFQLWINLSAQEKMKAPDYADIPTSEMEEVVLKNGTAKLIAGHWQLDAVKHQANFSAVSANASIADVSLQQGGKLNLTLGESETLLIYVYQGALEYQGNNITNPSLAVTSPGDTLQLETKNQTAGFLLLKGTPLQEPVVNYGPFVMNTKEQINQAIEDYRLGKFI